MPTNPINSINNFMNKTFGVPLPKSQTPTPFIGPVPNQSYAGPNMSIVPRNDRQALGTYGMTPSNPAATSPTPVKITAGNTPALPPAGNTFVNNQIQASYDAKTGARTAAGAAAGLPDMLGGKPVVPGTGNPTTDSTGALVADTGSTTTTKTPDSPYMAYLKSLFDPKAVSSAYGNYTDATNKLIGIQNSEDTVSTRGRHAAEDAFDRPGGTTSGASQSSLGIERKTNRELADLATQEGAAARSAAVFKDTYDTLISAGKSVDDATNAANKAAQEQSNADRTYNLDKSKADQAKLDADRKFEEDKKEFGMQYALDAKKVAIEQQKVDQTDPNSTVTSAKAATDAASSMNLINQLISNPNVKSISGPIQGFLGLGNIDPRSNVQLARNQFNQIKGMLALENRSKLKGQGAVSDFEGRTLDAAASSLGRNLGDEEFVNQLKQVRGAIATSHGLSADVKVEDPITHESQILTSDSAGIAQAIQDGLLVTYQ